MQVQHSITKTSWCIDRMHSQIGFAIKHLLFTNVRGRFNEYVATICTTGYDFLSAGIEVRINAASITTHDDTRDQHLKSADFFDVEQFGEIIFKGGQCKHAGAGNDYFLYGDLTIKGISRQVNLFVTFNGIVLDPLGIEKAVFNIEGKINRKDWGLTWNASLEAGGLLVGDEVLLDIELQLVKEGQSG